MAKHVGGDTSILNIQLARSIAFITSIGSQNPEMLYNLRLAQEACRSQAPVLVTGESGTGKSLLAQSIHYASPMRNQPCVTVECGADDAETELFGLSYDFEETSFQEGAFGRAAGGTLIIEGIDKLSQSTMKSILQVVEEGRYRLAGSGKTHPLRARIVSTSGSDLAEKATHDYFLEGLIYTLGEVTLRLPPLRERREDIVALTERAIRAANRTYGKRVTGLTQVAWEFLENYDFPGNIRELNHIINRAVNMTNRETLYVEDFGFSLDAHEADPHSYPDSILLPLHEMEKRHIGKALEHTNWNRKAAARILHITQPALDRKIRVYGLDQERKTINLS